MSSSTEDNDRVTLEFDEQEEEWVDDTLFDNKETCMTDKNDECNKSNDCSTKIKENLLNDEDKNNKVEGNDGNNGDDRVSVLKNANSKNDVDDYNNLIIENKSKCNDSDKKSNDDDTTSNTYEKDDKNDNNTPPQSSNKVYIKTDSILCNNTSTTSSLIEVPLSSFSENDIEAQDIEEQEGSIIKINVVNELFDKIDIKYRNIIKLCFCSLMIFSEMDEIVQEPKTAITYKRFTNILTPAICMLWRELVDGSNDILKLLLKNHDDERNNLFSAVQQSIDEEKLLQDEMKKKELSSTRFQSIRQKYRDFKKRYQFKNVSNNDDTSATNETSDYKEIVEDIESLLDNEQPPSPSDLVNENELFKFIYKQLLHVGVIKPYDSQSTDQKQQINKTSDDDTLPNYICIFNDMYYQYALQMADSKINNDHQDINLINFEYSDDLTYSNIFHHVMAHACMNLTILDPNITDCTNDCTTTFQDKENEAVTVDKDNTSTMDFNRINDKMKEIILKENNNSESILYALMMLPTHILRSSSHINDNTILRILTNPTLISGRIILNYKDLFKKYQQDCEEYVNLCKNDNAKDHITLVFESIKEFLLVIYPLSTTNVANNDDKHVKDATYKYTDQQRIDLHDIARIFQRIGKYYSIKKWFVEAIQYFEIALQYKKQANDVSMQSTLRFLGTAHMKIGNITQGMKYHEEALELDKVQIDDDDKLKISGVLKNMAIMYVANGEYEKSISCYEQALDIEKAKLGFDHNLVANTYNKLGIVYGIVGRFGKAIRCYNEYLRLTKLKLGEHDPLIAEILYRLGRLYFRKRKLIEAKEYFIDALRKWRKFNDDSGYDKINITDEYIHENAMRCLHSLGLTHTYLHEYDSACDCYDDVLRTQQQKRIDMMKDNDTSDNTTNLIAITTSIAQTMFDLSLNLKSSGKIDEALMKLQELIDILNAFKQQNVISNDSKKYDLHVAILFSDAYNMQGKIHRSKGNHEQALESYQSCLRIKEEHYSAKTESGEQSGIFSVATSDSSSINTTEHQLEIAECMHNIGDSYYLLENLDEAMSYYENANTIRTQVLGEEHFSSSSDVKNSDKSKRSHHHMDIANTKNNIGIVCLKKGGQEYVDYALESFLDCLTLRKEVFGEDSELVAAIYHNLGIAYEMNDDLDESMKNFEHAIRIRRKKLGDFHPKVAETLYNIALLHSSKGNASRSMKCFQRMVSILRHESNGLSDDYFHIQNALKWISVLENKIISSKGSSTSSLMAANQFEDEIAL